MHMKWFSLRLRLNFFFFKSIICSFHMGTSTNAYQSKNCLQQNTQFRFTDTNHKMNRYCDHKSVLVTVQLYVRNIMNLEKPLSI